MKIPTMDQIVFTIRSALAPLLTVKREIKEVESWDGSASNYPDTAAYCSACLIDVNPDGEDKVQALCMLPVRGPGDEPGVYQDKAVMAAAGGRGITQVEKPEGVEQATWDSAVKSAANEIVSAYEQMDRVAPQSVYDLAGKERPEEAGQPTEEPDMPVDESRSISSGTMMTQVYESLNETIGMDDDGYSNFWINDLYFDPSGQPFVVISYDGKLYRAAISVANDTVTIGDLAEVVIDFPPAPAQPEAEEMRSQTTIRRQVDGRYRWFGVSCSAVLNRVGAFDTRSLFDSFAESFKNEKQEVIRQFYHQGSQFRTGVVDFVARDGNLLITSGVYDDSPLAMAEVGARMKDPDYWGDSIGFVATEPEMIQFKDGIEIPAYTRGILREVSTLPEVDAASHFTVQSVTNEEVTRMLQGKALEAFIQLWGGDEEKARKWLEENPDKMNRAIETLGLQTRAAPATARQESQVEPTEPAQPDQTEIVLGEAELQEIARMVALAQPFEQLRTSMQEDQKTMSDLAKTLTGVHEIASHLEALEARLLSLEKSDEQKREAWLADLPQPKRLTVTYRPSADQSRQAQPGDQESEKGQTALAALPAYPFQKKP